MFSPFMDDTIPLQKRIHGLCLWKMYSVCAWISHLIGVQLHPSCNRLLIRSVLPSRFQIKSTATWSEPSIGRSVNHSLNHHDPNPLNQTIRNEATSTRTRWRGWTRRRRRRRRRVGGRAEKNKREAYSVTDDNQWKLLTSRRRLRRRCCVLGKGDTCCFCNSKLLHLLHLLLLLHLFLFDCHSSAPSLWLFLALLQPLSLASTGIPSPTSTSTSISIGLTRIKTPIQSNPVQSMNPPPSVPSPVGDCSRISLDQDSIDSNAIDGRNSFQ